MTFEVLKGTSDFEPKKQIQINKIIDVVRKNFENYGFRPFDTPLIEYLETLAYKYDKEAEIVQEIFKLTDRGDRQLGLRYDLTTPLCRFVAQNPLLKKPFRRYHIAKVFRDGPLKKGRMREFYQLDGDVIGQGGIEIEAELLDLFYTTYKELGLNVEIELNNNKILRGALLQFGAKEKDLSNYILLIDKLKKIKLKGVLDEINQKNLNQEIGKKAIEILDSKDFTQIKKLAKDNLLKEGIDELETLCKALKELKVDFKINYTLSRGLDIYTGNIWESYDKNKKISSSLGSGGRYDKVIGEYSSREEDISAVGISFGLVPIIEVISQDSNQETLTDILLVPLTPEMSIESQKLAKKLRTKLKKNIEIYYEYSMKKAFKYTDSLNIENIIFFGEKDFKNKLVQIKNLKTKEIVEIKL